MIFAVARCRSQLQTRRRQAWPTLEVISPSALSSESASALSSARCARNYDAASSMAYANSRRQHFRLHEYRCWRQSICWRQNQTSWHVADGQPRVCCSTKLWTSLLHQADRRAKYCQRLNSVMQLFSLAFAAAWLLSAVGEARQVNGTCCMRSTFRQLRISSPRMVS